MRNCLRCGMDFPQLIWECPKCGCRLVKDGTNPSITHILKLYSDLNRRGGGMYDQMKRSLIASRNGGRIPDPAEIDREYRQNARAEVEMFYSRYAEILRTAFPRSQLATYMKQYMGDGGTPDAFELQGKELILTLMSFIKRAEDAVKRQAALKREEEQRVKDEISRQKAAERRTLEHEAMMRRMELDAEAEAAARLIEPVEDIDTMARRMKLKALQLVSDQLDAIAAKLDRISDSDLPDEIREEEEATLMLKQSTLTDRFLKLQEEVDC
jgi:hypothetical protein